MRSSTAPLMETHRSMSSHRAAAYLLDDGRRVWVGVGGYASCGVKEHSEFGHTSP